MTTHIHKSRWQRVETWWIAAAVIAALLFAIPHRIAGADRLAATPALPTRLTSEEPVTFPGRLPFGAADAIHYFSTVLEMSPERGADGVTLFENQQVTHPEDRWHIAVWVEGRDVVVEFRVGGDYGMTLAREFFESPLFARAESEQLYGMLNDAKNGMIQRLPRFTVRMKLSQTTDLLTLTLRFTPRDAA